jgi:hypothetical protein
VQLKHSRLAGRRVRNPTDTEVDQVNIRLGSKADIRVAKSYVPFMLVPASDAQHNPGRRSPLSQMCFSGRNQMPIPVNGLCNHSTQE